MWFLGMDIGTGGTRAVIVDGSGKLVSGASSEHAPFKTPHPGWAEQEPEDWWRAAQEAIRGAIEAAPEPHQPIAALGLTMAYTRLGAQVRKIAWLPALFLLAALIGPWLVLVSIAHPFFLPFFFVHEHFSRFLTTVHHRTAPIYFYIPVLLAGFLPWSVFLPKIFLSAFANRGQAMKRDPARAFFIIWGLFIFSFFYIFVLFRICLIV